MVPLMNYSILKFKFVSPNHKVKELELLISCKTININQMTEVSIYERYCFPQAG